jgi:hypothetical protein
MKELHVEGVATRNDPESCGWHREVSFEALTGASVGADIEPRKYIPEADPVSVVEGDMDRAVIARRGTFRRGLRPGARREPFGTRTGRSQECQAESSDLAGRAKGHPICSS